MLSLVATATGAFVATNLDDLVVLAALFGSRRLTTAQIALGQYLGIGLLIGVSALIAGGLAAVPTRWFGLFGLIPLGLGIRALRSSGGGHAVATSALGVFAITVADGADNVAVYVPLFRSAGWATLGYVAIFAVLVAAWIGLGAFIASRTPVVRVLDRWGRWIIPSVFIAIGVALLIGTIVG